MHPLLSEYTLVRVLASMDSAVTLHPLAISNQAPHPVLPYASLPLHRAAQLVGWCGGQATHNQPFGVNPHFVETSSLYDPSLWAAIDQLSNGSYGTKLSFNPNGIPYGFIYPVVRGIHGSLVSFKQDLRSLEASTSSPLPAMVCEETLV